jgi:hypothetical protein
VFLLGLFCIFSPLDDSRRGKGVSVEGCSRDEESEEVCIVAKEAKLACRRMNSSRLSLPARYLGIAS